MTRRAFTLVEVLATVALLALVMSFAMIGLGGAIDEAAMLEAVAAMRDLDARARTAAQSVGSVELHLDGGDAALRVMHTGEIVARRELAHGGLAGVSDSDGRRLEQVRFDRSGRSADYMVEIAVASHARRLRVAGLTGLVVEERP
jgi:prepilin-type N-terminal cleavage/methylation domain-containing protein